MTYHYSKTTGGLYDTDFAAYDLPADAVDLTGDEYAALVNAERTEHKVIRADASGRPVAVDPATLLTLDQVKSNKLSELAVACSSRMDAIKAGYPAEEVQSWDKQESEARAYAASNTAATPLLSALAAARGITLADLAARVIAKADLFAAASGAIIGKRQHYEDQVTAATDAATVEAIVWQD